jgi:heme-degrading monooxygenase HmoA
MMRFDDFDATTPFSTQMRSSHEGLVVLINRFAVAPDEADALVDAWSHDAAFFKEQPGFISAQLHRGVGGNSVFFNYAVWASLDAFRRAFEQPEFRARLGGYPSSTVAAPFLLERIAVPDICTA